MVTAIHLSQATIICSRGSCLLKLLVRQMPTLASDGRLLIVLALRDSLIPS